MGLLSVDWDGNERKKNAKSNSHSPGFFARLFGSSRPASTSSPTQSTPRKQSHRSIPRAPGRVKARDYAVPAQKPDRRPSDTRASARPTSTSKPRATHTTRTHTRKAPSPRTGLFDYLLGRRRHQVAHRKPAAARRTHSRTPRREVSSPTPLIPAPLQRTATRPILHPPYPRAPPLHTGMGNKVVGFVMCNDSRRSQGEKDADAAQKQRLAEKARRLEQSEKQMARENLTKAGRTR